MARQLRGSRIPAGNMKRAAWWYYYMGGSGGGGAVPVWKWADGTTMKWANGETIKNT